jgi:8-oxo-dGTP pyrophosphatase MutT (NUDIX family)
VSTGNAALRLAATVVAVRPAGSGVEVLVLRRGASSRFLPGYVVFPGGAVDEGDAELAGRWFGTAAETARATAVRELAEEAGVAVTGAGVVAAGADAALAAVDASPPPAAALSEISHWVAPVDVPVRFDARYFAVEAPGDLAVTPDGREADEAWWANPGVLMTEWAEGKLRLYWPTMKTMESLARCGSVAELLTIRIPQQEPGGDDERVLPPSTFDQDA